MKIIQRILLIGLTVFMFCSCGLFGQQQYFCEADAVKSVQIVRLDDYIEEEYRYDYTVLSEIADCSAFADRLNNLDHSVNWGNPMPLYVDYVVILVYYSNGDYDLLHPNAQRFHRSGKNQNGYFFFDKGQFDTLIQEYLT